MNDEFELALVARVGANRSPVVVASIRDAQMLEEALSHAVAAALQRVRDEALMSFGYPSDVLM